jgi:hypothetical protein
MYDKRPCIWKAYRMRIAEKLKRLERIEKGAA